MDTRKTLDVLNRARRPLDSLPQVEIIDEWKYNADLKVWYLHIIISIEYDSMVFPSKSQWYVVVDSGYPNGKIKVYPDVNNSLNSTLYHQGNNSSIEENGLWRKGALCLEVNTLKGNQTEPFTVDERLLYHVMRAINWLELAAQGRLVSSDEPFEMPDFSEKYSERMQFVFSEDVVSFMQWESTECRFGIAELDVYKNKPLMYYVKFFKSIHNRVEHYTEWGTYLSKQTVTPLLTAPWILLNNIPVVNEWQTPETLEDLLEICKKQGIDILSIFQKVFSKIRDGKRHLLLVGFPIPKLFGGESEIIFWKALYLPVLSHGKKTANGFRNNQQGWWMRDKTEILTKKLKLEWLCSENWNQNEISQRGKMDNAILRKRILLIGAGCVGASIAELLVRAGVYNLTIVDSDIFEIGNTSRHTLNMKEIGNLKEVSLRDHLNLINPHANIKAIHEKVIVDEDGNTNIDINNYDIIVDCTGENSVLDIFQNIKLEKEHIFISISVGLGAKRMYMALKKGKEFDFSSFGKLITPYLQEERSLYDDYKLPRNGIGCWHPTFPARSDDIYLAATTAVKMIEKFVVNLSNKNLSLIYEQKETEFLFGGYQVVDKCEE